MRAGDWLLFAMTLAMLAGLAAMNTLSDPPPERTLVCSNEDGEERVRETYPYWSRNGTVVLGAEEDGGLAVFAYNIPPGWTCRLVRAEVRGMASRFARVGAALFGYGPDGAVTFSFDPPPGWVCRFKKMTTPV